MGADPSEALSGVALSLVDTAQGKVQFRSSGMAQHVTHVLLHGIGSASASWAYQLNAAVGRSDIKVLAWDAPGYGQSSHLPIELPTAQDYAERLWSWLDYMRVSHSVVLVGHSLGALIAASATRLRPQSVSSLFLLAPARGYGDAPLAERERVVQGRLNNLQQLGAQGMAKSRAAAMLSSNAATALKEAVRETMSQIDPAGYTQAVQMLGQANLAQDLKSLTCPVAVASGDVDTVTTPASCERVAEILTSKRISLGPVGHACPLEAAEAVNDLLGLSTLGVLR